MSHSNEFWNFENADRSENTPKGYFKPLFPHNLGRPLHHPEQDYNAHLIGQIIKGYRVIGSGSDGEMTTADLELGIKLHEVNPGDGTPGSADEDYAHYIEAGAKDYEWIWVPAEMGGINTSPFQVIGSATDKNDCQSQAATITATATGGTAMYEFSLQMGSNVSINNIQDWSQVNVFTEYANSPLVPGNTYWIYGRDAVGANDISDPITPSEIFPHTANGTVTQDVTIPSGDDGTLEVTVAGGTGPYTYELWQGADPNNTGTATLIQTINSTIDETVSFPNNVSGSDVNLGAGQYFIITNDGNTGCSITTTLLEITQPAPLSSIAAPFNANCENGDHEFQFLMTSGGTAPYEYSITDPNTTGYTWVADPVFTNIPAGNTAIYPAVRDSVGFIIDLGIHTFANPLPYSFAVGSNPVGCGGSLGLIVFSSLQGGPPVGVLGYALPAIWQFSTDNGLNWSADWEETTPGEQYSVPKAAGTYQCKIRRVNSLTGEVACESPFQEIIVGSVAQISAQLSSVDDITCGSGGSGEINISQISVGGQNATLDYSVEWLDINDANNTGIVQNQTTASYDITGLDAATYNITITDTDPNSDGCVFTGIIQVADATSTIQLIIDDSSDPSCNGGTDGYVDLSVTNGTAPYTYSYNTGGNDIVLEAGSPNDTWSEIGSFGADDYEFTVVDGNGCSDSIPITLTDPTIVTATISNIIDAGCFGQSDGQLTANGSGGSGQYTYSWDNGETTQTISNLTAGDYSVVVTDSNGCVSAAVTENINEFNNTTIVLDSQTNVTCNGESTGSAQITVTGDTPFTFQWIDITDPLNPIISTDQNPTGLHAAEYIVTATSSTGCATSSSAEGWTLLITEPSAIQLSISSTSPESVTGQNDGSVTIDLLGGAGQYDVQLQDSNGNGPLINGTLGQSQFVFNNLAPGAYTIIGGDIPNGCPISGSFTIATGTGTVTIDSTSQSVINCNGGNGTFTMTVSGGSGNYEFSDDNNTWIADTSPYTFTGPYQGGTTHTFYVKDIDTQDTDSTQYTFTHPAVISAGVSTTAESILGANDGEISISNITGGSGTYTLLELFDINGSVATISSPSASGPHVFDNLAADNYVIQITDDNGCTDNVSGTVADGSAGLSISTSQPGNILCNGGSTDVTVNVTGGSGTYRFSSDDGATWTGYLNVNSYTFNLAAGTYVIKVEDQQTYPNNIVTDSVTLSEPTAVSIAQIEVINESIQGQGDGSITITIAGGTPEYGVQVNDANGNGTTINGTGGQTIFVFSNLDAGAYTILGGDANSCPISGNFTVATGGAQINIVSLIPGNILCNGGSTDVTMTVSGGSGNYEYATNPSNNGSYNGPWDSVTQSTTNTWNVVTGTRYFFVRDADTGTIASSFVTVNQPNAISFTTTGAETYPGANDVTLVAIASGGTAPYTVTSGSETQTITTDGGNAQFTTITSAGTYTFNVLDDNGCTEDFQVVIGTQYTNLSFTSVTSSSTCYGENNGLISFVGAGGSGIANNYEWSIDGGPNGGTWTGPAIQFSNLSGGTYDLWLRDTVTGEEIEYTNNPITVQEGLEIQVITSTIQNGTCNAHPSYYIKFSGSNLTSDIVANQSVTLEWSLGNNGGANNTTANLTNITSLGNNQFEGTLSFDALTSVNNNGTFTVKIISDGCEENYGPISYITETAPVLTSTLISEPACPSDDWIYEMSATGGPNNSYDLQILGAPNNLATGWDGTATQYSIPQNGGTSDIRLYDIDFINNSCYDSKIVTSSDVTAMSVSGSINNPACYGSGNASTLGFSITGGLPSGNTYKYKISTDGGGSWGAEQSYSGVVSGQGGLSNGTIHIKAYRIVNNGNSTEDICHEQQYIGVVENPNPINGSISSSTSPTACTGPGATDGVIKITVSGGTGDYTNGFSKNGGSTWQTLTLNNGTYDFTGLSAGTYSIKVRDNNNCEAFTDTITLSAPSSPTVQSHSFAGCWRNSDSEQVQLEIFLTDTAGQNNGEYTFYDPTADAPTTNTGGKFYYSNSDMTTHTQGPVVITETATGCSTTMNNFNFTSVPEITSTASITDINGSPNVGDINDFTVSNVVGGYGPPYTVSLISGGSTYATVTVPNQNGTAYIYDIPAGDYTYSVSDTLNGTTACGKTYTTPMTATVQQVNEETFYYLHGGSGTMPYFGDMTAANASYYRNDGTITNSLTDAFADLLVYPGGGVQSNQANYPVIGNFEFAGPIDGQQGCFPTWTHVTTPTSELYYIAVPKNSAFNVNLVTDGLMEEGCNGQIYNCSSRKEFYIGSENYWLYNIGATSTAALSYGFK
jgi:hypothetical protein